MSTRFVVFDIETVPDDNVVSLLPATRKPSAVPPPIANRIVAISFVTGSVKISGDSCQFLVDRIGSVGTIEDDEPQIISGFWRGLRNGLPQAITWNGRGFDVPVMLHRSFILGLPANAWFLDGVSRYNGYGYRYGDKHLDLMDSMADYGATRNYSLGLVASSIGMPGKVGGHGSEVVGMYQSGRLSEIRDYCECDCFNLFGIYVRWALLTGRCSKSNADASISHFRELLETQATTSRSARIFVEAWSAIETEAAA